MRPDISADVDDRIAHQLTRRVQRRLSAQGVGVQSLTLTVPVLDARVIESIRGLDT